MSIKPLIFTIVAAQFTTNASLVCGTVSAAMNNIGPTNLQKIAIVLKETQESQKDETEKQKKNVALAKALLESCGKISGSDERTACENKYQPIVRSSMRVCGADCQ